MEDVNEEAIIDLAMQYWRICKPIDPERSFSVVMKVAQSFRREGVIVFRAYVSHEQSNRESGISGSSQASYQEALTSLFDQIHNSILNTLRQVHGDIISCDERLAALKLQHQSLINICRAPANGEE